MIIILFYIFFKIFKFDKFCSLKILTLVIIYLKLILFDNRVIINMKPKTLEELEAAKGDSVFCYQPNQIL